MHTPHLSRRSVLTAGALAVGGLTLSDLLRARAAQPAPRTRGKSVIMVYLNGGPSHMDMYDLKPDAPAESRGEFSPIQTNVPGIQISERQPADRERSRGQNRATGKVGSVHDDSCGPVTE